MAERIILGASSARELFHRLVLVVGPARSGKTSALREAARAKGWRVVNLNLVLSEKLLGLTRRQRALEVSSLVREIAEDGGEDVVLVDNIELLFDPELSLDPLRLLQGLSRSRTLCVAWPGTCDGAVLTYAEPSHPEARRYSDTEAIIVTTDEPVDTPRQEHA